MATAIQGFRLTARNCARASFSQRHAIRTNAQLRGFSTTQWNQAPSDTNAAMKKAQEASGVDLKKLEAELKESRKDIEEYLEADVDFGPSPPDLAFRGKKLKETFLNMGEQEPFEEDMFIEDDEDDISSIAHGELEQHREFRHYARLAAWEMPMLSKLSKPFEVPGADMPLRFRYTTYMGESHPAEKKVVLEFSPLDMPDLTDLQRDKMRKLLGTRYNPELDTVRMSCEMFETQAQNKRYLGDLVDSLLAEARDPTDTFADVPLDTRHHHFKPKLRFPKEWEMTEERRNALEDHRQKQISKDQQLELQGQLVDGVEQIKEALLAKPVETVVPEMVTARKGSRAGGGKRLAVRR
ncbi:hypothetical protein HYALB_00012026 [Hymenoscyphus albidus]|uniref:Small ribosomal subunit protein mS35 mitochondrial conserved domain-containing protein n=1 Tax=Hymenoscyphus albidus TaxID=595503 RepID=A0A9N9Q7N2_9HELO|nr:hypothetical protein HYALB_00012026 [Hymenoscyphus albidus]